MMERISAMMLTGLVTSQEIVGYPAPKESLDFTRIVSRTTVNTKRYVVANFAYYLHIIAQINGESQIVSISSNRSKSM